MFGTIDAINNGHFFWRSLIAGWPLPFSMETTDSAVMVADTEEMVISVVRIERQGEARVAIEVRDTLSDNSLLTVTLTHDLIYVNGVARGMHLDEVGAADLMQIFVPMIRGEWTQGSLRPEDEQEGKEDHHA